MSRMKASAGRASVGAGTDGKARPVVSGPIAAVAAVPEASAVGAAKAGDGAGWASQIDADAVANLPDRERKRQEAIFELIRTEQSYVQALQQVTEVFFQAVRPALTARAAQIIFANVDDILLFNTIFLSELEDRQRRSQLYVDQIGDVVKTHVKGLDVYRPYCVNQTNAANTLASLRAEDPKLRAALDKARINGLDLAHFLLEPMQRLTRYPLLIGNILKYTDPDHNDRPALARALEVAEQILGGVNESVRSHQDLEKLLKLSDALVFPGVKGARLDLAAPTRSQGPRKILKEGKLAKAKSGRKLMGYLFSDLLLFTEERPSGEEVVYKYVSAPSIPSRRSQMTDRLRVCLSWQPIPLEECSVREHARDDSAFTVTHRGEALTVRAASARQGLQWVRVIEQARQASLAAMAKTTATGARRA